MIVDLKSKYLIKAREKRPPWWLCHISWIVTLLWIGLFLYAQHYDLKQAREIEAYYLQQIDELQAKIRAMQKEDGESLAFKNKNPLNIKAIKGGWLGQVGTDRFGHAIFQSYEYGIRAAALVLINYEALYGICTLQDLVNRFCKSNRAEYAQFLAKRLNIAVDEPFTMKDRLHELLHAMARWESGKEWRKDPFVSYQLLSR